MGTQSFTPGRWFVEHSSVRVLSDDPRATIVCEVTGSPSNPQSVADARLIAAAPELLEVLTAFVKYDSSQHDDTSLLDNNALWEMAETAIAKATGAQP